MLEIVDDGTGPWVYYKLINEPSAQVSLKHEHSGFDPCVEKQTPYSHAELIFSFQQINFVA